MEELTFQITIKVKHTTNAKKFDSLAQNLEHKAIQLQNLCATKIREAVKMNEGEVSDPTFETKITLK